MTDTSNGTLTQSVGGYRKRIDIQDGRFHGCPAYADVDAGVA